MTGNSREVIEPDKSWRTGECECDWSGTCDMHEIENLRTKAKKHGYRLEPIDETSVERAHRREVKKL